MTVLTSILAIIVLLLIFAASTYPLLLIPNFQVLLIVTGLTYGVFVLLTIGLVDSFGLWSLVKTMAVCCSVTAALGLGRLWHIKYDK